VDVIEHLVEAQCQVLKTFVFLLKLNEYLASVQIDEDNPGFLFDWQEDNIAAFVAVANRLERERLDWLAGHDRDQASRVAGQAAPWLRARSQR
jgi:hypothetical protein